MSMISELVKELRTYPFRGGHMKYVAELMDRAADVIEMLSEKVRADGWVPCSEGLPEHTMSEEQEFVQVDKEYLMELEQKAKACEYFRGQVYGMEYVMDVLQEVLKGKESNA